MLTTLRIRNLALVADLTLELGAGFIAISGETGAGKSVILGALNLVLGQRADRTTIRTGADACTVEAAFDVRGLRAQLAGFFSDHGLEPGEDGQLVIKRSFSLAGTNRQFVNGSPTALSTLAKLGEWLVDLHGPHEHQSLLQPARQLAILDAFGGLKPALEAIAELVRRRSTLESTKAGLIVDERTYAQQLDLLRFQTREITEARLSPEEESRVEAEFQRASNAARLLELTETALAGLGDGDDAAMAPLGTVGRVLHDLQRIDPNTSAYSATHGQAVSLLRDLQADLSRYVDKIDLDPMRLRELEERLNQLHMLKRKYGPSLADVIAFGEEAQDKLQALEGRDTEVTRLNAELRRLESELVTAAQSLSAARRKLIPKLAKAVAKELAQLGFPQSAFTVTLAALPEVSATGADACEFQFAPNPGEPARSLRAIASSGELARVMLALKTVLAAEDEVPVLVFDEVDANVGGETARAVGQKMRQIARQHQVLCITHLAPVAAAADAHYVVSKSVVGGRTESRMALLNPSQRIEELSRMLGGATKASRRHAEELLREKPGS
jgi:DNA repair protein RecN (Recombination protein N)